MEDKQLEELSNVAGDDLTQILISMAPKQRLYFEARLSNMAPYPAAKAAGLANPEVNAYAYEKHPKIQAALIAATKQAVAEMEITRDTVLKGLMEAVHTAVTSTELVGAWREIAKIVGAYEPVKHEHTVNIHQMSQEQLGKLSDRELLKLVDEESAMVDSADDPLEAEYEVLSEAIKEPRAIRYGNDPKEI